MRNRLPLTSIIIVCRNEENFISKCLDSIIDQDYPKDRLEILIIDGMSQDRTRELIKNYIKKYPYFKLFTNPKKITSTALNIGIKNSKAEAIILMGSHAIYQNNYISQCVKYLQDHNVDNVGGISIILPQNNTHVAKAIAFSLSNPFGAGNACYKTGYLGKPKLVDTVFGGCYKRKVFEKIGFFHEELLRNQDLEFNLRLKKAGGKILLAPEIVSYYYPKPNFKSFFIHNFKDGFWVVFPLKFGIKTFSWRHLIPIFFVLVMASFSILAFFSLFFLYFLFLIISLYFLFNFCFSVKIATREKNWRFLFLSPVAFICRHIGYGLGSIWGILNIIFKK